MENIQSQLRQRGDYTHKFNTNLGRHGWLRLTPAYSVKVVEEVMGLYKSDLKVLDPFCGTGTTALSAANRGHNATTIDINPFLVWFASSKFAEYSPSTLMEVEKIGKDALHLARQEAVQPSVEPTIHKIDRWWNEPALRFLCHLKAAILQLAGDDSKEADILHVAFCRTLIGLSNAAFNHQSMSFKNNRQCKFNFSDDEGSVFLNDLRFVLNSASKNPTGRAQVILGDARDMSSFIDKRFDLVITSPPYVNRMSYIRELRPYMYWLGYLTNGRDAGEFDWSAIGGTWGVATSRLMKWSPNTDLQLPDDLSSVIFEIAKERNSSGILLANYVSKYFQDMALHFSNMRCVLSPGAQVHYIIGNSSFYGVLVSSEGIYATMLRDCGFEDVTVRPIRKRNSKKELMEFDVSATWPGG